MNYTEKGSKIYLFSIVLVAVIGGLLFGYDTAVISGAEKGLQAFFMGADFEYTDAIHGITSSSALIGGVTTGLGIKVSTTVAQTIVADNLHHSLCQFVVVDRELVCIPAVLVVTTISVNRT